LSAHTLESGREALAYLRATIPALLLLDLRLPDVDGLDVARTLHRNVRFIVISGYLSSIDAIQAMRLGALQVVQKPLTLEDIVAIVRKYVVERPGTTALTDPHSLPDRWARYVLHACWSETDLSGLQAWATWIGVSYTQLRETCSL